MSIEARNVSFKYASEDVLHDFSFSLRPGDFVTLLGPNGSGKSTALKLLAGYLAPTAGEILMDGVPLAEIPHRERARRLAVVPQTPVPALDFTVEEMVMMGRHARLSKMAPPGAEDLRLVEETLERLDILRFRTRACNRLSGGERQRVAIAAALVQQPRFLLLDEPTSALDPAHSFRVMELLESLPESPGILMITHDLNLAMRYAAKIVLLRKGGILCEGAPECVLTARNIFSAYQCNAQVIPGVGIVLRK